MVRGFAYLLLVVLLGNFVGGQIADAVEDSKALHFVVGDAVAHVHGDNNPHDHDEGHECNACHLSHHMSAQAYAAGVASTQRLGATLRFASDTLNGRSQRPDNPPPQISFS